MEQSVAAATTAKRKYTSVQKRQRIRFSFLCNFVWQSALPAEES